jgi:hypothetical protein
VIRPGPGGYRPLDSSLGLQGLTTAVVDSVLARRFELGETALIKEFRGRVSAG